MNVGEIKVNFGYVDDITKPGLNRFGVRLTSKSEKHIAYEVPSPFSLMESGSYLSLKDGISSLEDSSTQKTPAHARLRIRPTVGLNLRATPSKFRTLKNEDYKELAPGILKPGEIIELDRFLPVDADVDQDCCHLLYREVQASEKDAKAAMRKEGYYDGELIVFKKH
ncbi:hypothetical protein PRIPAC_87065 [Pristionchus pacificus]|uniref:Uncharacterized protein n=1 Tax=Pristionchus pacificus TaxID=54126 RepID=A0A454Y136_PRIPA|nr:hypothetical protein PRIPAC_87065 [Pristionchus pacificus]|eukprot:PDM69717.1 hypothetical protein PRIPAC_44813 [Pristionchus pacificus]